MSRVSLQEMYDDKDVVTQICRLKDTVNDYAGGIIENIDVSGNNIVIDWEDGTSISLPLPDPVTGISSVTGSVAGGNLTITFYFTNGTTHSFTCPLSGMATEAYVDAGLATKADASDVYTKTEVDNALASKANITDIAVKTSITDLPDMADGATIHAININGNTSDTIFIVSLKRINAFWYTGTCHGLVVDGVTYDHDYAITLAYDYPTIIPDRMTLTWDDNGVRKTKVFENITTLGFGVSNH